MESLGIAVPKSSRLKVQMGAVPGRVRGTAIASAAPARALGGRVAGPL